MKVLIVGGTSSLGMALKPFLNNSFEVFTAGRSNCDFHLDLSSSPKSISMPNWIDVVIHCAAHFGGESDDQIIESEIVNVLGTLKLCQSSLHSGVKHIIYISSMSASLNEDSKYFGIYGITKRHAEELATYYCSIKNIPLTILRPSQIYGEDLSFRKHQPFLYKVIEQAEKGEDVTIFGSNDALRNYIHSDDLSSVVLNVILNGVQGIFSVLGPEDISLSNVAKLIVGEFDNKSSINFDRSKTNIPDNVFQMDETIYKLINYFPKVTVKEGIKRLVNSMKQHS